MPKSDGYKNLIKPSTDEARKRGSKGGKRSGEVRRANKTLRQIVKDWADGTPTQDEFAKLAEIGITDGNATRKATLLIPLLSNVAGGNMRALNMLMDLLGEDDRKKQELAKLRAETKLVEAETEKIRLSIGDNTDEKSALDKLCETIAKAAQK